ncbi:DNA repair protein RadA/Sms [Ekhidna lutea]|uniref:DNA repair protein RadA n=1 Tax=Ekhidna lutea TaxID=447679 RepID=A0A239EBN4_EKHLU|nr:DNA repair protein RadA [Ekhidna lutea]SNS41881.1 DNA repair protein RadA/Sms [Ekhidna lutea]
MAKTKTVFFCQSCGTESAKWVGKCPSCGEWNTYVEEVVSKSTASAAAFTSEKSKPINIKETGSGGTKERTSTGIRELDRVLGGGIVDGSLVLVGGEPGIGKSTIMLQMAIKLNKKILYVSGEESAEQIKMRADRIGTTSDQCFLYAETSLSEVIRQADDMGPDIIIIDSIQTLHSDRIEAAIGSISQVKECTGQLMKFAKQKGVPVFLIGHVNKDGAIAGPKVLEHMVDTVLQFEGDRHLTYRILRTVKNRFGSTSELGMFEMNVNGLREVTNPSEVLISPREPGLSGISLGVTVEGNRPLILETQALVSPTSYGNPQRSTTGYDYKRMTMLLAVMEKRLGIRLSTQDVFLNIAGGLKVQDTALDMAICSAIFSSFEDVPMGDDVCFAAEIGLGGEIRPVSRIENRINEAQKLGFKEIYISKHNLKAKDIGQFKIKVRSFSKLSEAFGQLF